MAATKSKKSKTAEDRQREAREAAEATAGGAAQPGTDPQPSAPKDGGQPVTQEQAAATEAVSPQEQKVEAAPTDIHDALTALEQAWANVPLVESERRPDLANLDEISERIDAAKKAVDEHRKVVKRQEKS